MVPLKPPCPANSYSLQAGKTDDKFRREPKSRYKFDTAENASQAPTITVKDMGTNRNSDKVMQLEKCSLV